MSSELRPCPHLSDSTLADSSILLHRRGPSDATSMSGPFMYADDLESVSDSFLSLYTEREFDPAESRLPYKHLLQYLEQCTLVRDFRHRISGIVKMVVEVGHYLFPPTHILGDEIRKKVVVFTTYINEFLETVVEHLRKQIEKTHQAFSRLPSPAVTDQEQLALSISIWTEILDSLHKPTGREGSVFRELSTIYSSHVYQPFLQLHRIEPSHNMWQLEAQLTPISLLLREAAALSDQADASVRAIEEEFEVTMTSRYVPAGDDMLDSGVSVDNKRHHTPSKSAPAIVTGPVKTILRPRDRENTL